MKRFVALLALLGLLLSGCAAEEQGVRTEELQRQYGEMTGCTARVNAAIPRGTETARYTLSAAWTPEETRVTVLEPKELKDVCATVQNDGELRLQFDGMVLDAGSASPNVSALNSVSILLHAAAEGYITEQSTERYADTEALRLCFETEQAGEVLRCTAYFDEENAPLYAELERDGEILAYLEFTDFSFGDILPTEQ